MNRETKRMLQRQGQLTEDGAQGVAPARAVSQRPAARTKPKQFVREVKGELRKVAWPTRAETLSLSLVVFVFLVLLTALIAGLDYGFSKAVLWIVDQ
jgi:preprotein translocase subunit SecE